ncbi:DUF308 domain-containing protein [Dysosmobacter sp.]|uniref:DUF308 domain-containing protein n=1 Tax=Dysosmobacter sp. TaxID=2591382 RepID=UPI002A8E95E2|nr:DUF308 domain-containing protein [Dysosmobacter sp.]MDY3282500.1 DUF308 domain-containing protein [Dysosmobacter sp.]
MKKLRLARDGYIVMSVVFYIAGLTYMFLPEISPMTICITSGIVLIIYGIIKVIGYCSDDLYCLAFQYDLACGPFLMVLGVIILACNQRIVAHLSVGLGVLVLLDSLLSIQTSKDARQFGLETWNVILATSVVAAVCGVLLIVRPYQSSGAAHLAAGGTLLAEGLKNHCVVILTVKTMKRHWPEREADSRSQI